MNKIEGKKNKKEKKELYYIIFNKNYFLSYYSYKLKIKK